MKKLVRKIVCLFLCISVLLSLTSCDAIYKKLKEANSKVPPGYTGGFNTDPHYHNTYEIKWLETYDELINAVTLLKANGTKIGDKRYLRREPIFNCEEYGLDVKFCIKFNRNLAEEFKEGKDYFDRHIEYVDIKCYVFLESVSINELEYDLLSRYKRIRVGIISDELFDDPRGADDIRIYYSTDENVKNGYYIYYYGKNQLGIDTNIDEIPEDVIEILEKTLTIIE